MRGPHMTSHVGMAGGADRASQTPHAANTRCPAPRQCLGRSIKTLAAADRRRRRRPTAAAAQVVQARGLAAASDEDTPDREGLDSDVPGPENLGSYYTVGRGERREEGLSWGM